MRFLILGPLEAHDGDRRVSLGGAKQRSLLAFLLLHANEVVSSDRLIEALWGEAGSEDAGKALSVAVSRLRRLLEPERSPGEPARLLVTRRPGYELRVEPDQLDLHRFERLVSEARGALAAADAASAAAGLRDALELWRGAPLADLAYESFAQAHNARLEELRMAALEDRIRADLELGLHGELVGELDGLVAEHPLRERLRELLMLALYRSGRQAEALGSYAHARHALVEELGIEPGRGLRDLQQGILRQDPALDRRPVGEATAEPSRGVFVGRERELGGLLEALEDALVGRGRVVLLAGEPGIGKSRLAGELIAHAQPRGVRVLVGRCWEAGGAPAYWPWIQSLRAYARETSPEVLATQLGAGAAYLAQLLPELRALSPELPELPALESEGARFRLFEAVSSFLQSATRAGPLALVLDDLHAADQPSLLLLQFVAREIGNSRLLVLGAYRDVDPTPRDPLTSTLAELVREPHTTQIVLTGLSEPDVAAYVELSSGTKPAPQLAQAVHAETEGNPLFMAEVVRLFDAEGRIGDETAPARIPPGVRAVIGQRLARLSDACRHLLVPAAVMGREFGLDALARMSELPRQRLLEVLDEAMAERVVGAVPGSPGRLRFGHALIRDTLYDELTPARRLQLHQDAGEALEGAHAADLEPHLAELAQHFIAAAPAGVADRAIEYARRAGDRAATQLAYEEAVRLYESALTLVDDPVARCELLLATGDAEARAGDTPASKRAFRAAAELAKDRRLAKHLARAALGYGGRILWDVSRDDEYLVPLLERAIAALGDGDSILRVRLLARLSGGPLRDASFPAERKATLSREALETARRIGDRGTLAYALDGYIAANHSPARTPEQVELATELLELAIEAGDLERAVEGYEHRLGGLIELGEMQRAKADLASMSRRAQELRQPSQIWFVAVLQAHLALLEGRFDEAEEHIDHARSLGERAQSWNAAVTFGLQRYLLRREQGRLGEVEVLVRRSVDDYPTYRIWRCILVQMTAELGHEAEARQALDALVADDLAALPFDEMWLSSIGFLAEAAESLTHAPAAAILYEPMLPFHNRVAVAYSELSMGSVARYLGLLATTMECWDDAERHFSDALEMNERIGSPPWLAHTQDDYARMLLARAAPGDREQALVLLGAALATYRRLGMGRWAETVAAKMAGGPAARNR
jgi:DNA-binding SARP family transcriptional activator/tetratricopeptide (TPR) repeat protein